MAIVTLYVTFPDRKAAQRICRTLVEERLAACANIFPVGSVYRWKRKVEVASEVAAFLKTTRVLTKKVQRRIVELHPYEIPCIGACDDTVNAACEKWIRESTTSRSV